jgi:hypothetical protein
MFVVAVGARQCVCFLWPEHVRGIGGNVPSLSLIPKVLAVAAPHPTQKCLHIVFLCCCSGHDNWVECPTH